MSDRPARVLALSPAAVDGRPSATLRDVEGSLEPALVWIPGPARDSAAVAAARESFGAPVVHPPIETGSGDDPFHAVDVDGRRLLVSPGARALAASSDAAARTLRESSTGTPTVVCDDVTTTVRPTALDTTLDHAGTLATALPTDAETTVLTGGLPADYDELWRLEPGTGDVLAVDHDPGIGAGGADGSTRGDGLDGTVGGDEPDDSPTGETVDDITGETVDVRIRGAGPAEGYGADESIVALELTSAGVEVAGTYAPDDFGLEAVSGIGSKTASSLVDRGITTRDELLDTPIRSLTELPGIGRTRAETMHQHATVLETGEPLLRTDDTPPGADWDRPPLCLDIETDGLSPTIIWQIGVYDPETDEYRAFVERSDPTDPGSVIEAFCDWLVGVHRGRALLTWNGWGFDYRHLTAFVQRHAGYYADEWGSVPKLDLFLWAVTDGNAMLPGRSNKLEDVAGALGYEFADTGLHGAATAAAYQRFARTGTELDWDRHERYCEDDCRALWHVFERLRDAARMDEGGSAAERGADVGAESERSTRDSTSRTDGEAARATTGPGPERDKAGRGTGSNTPASGASEQAGLGDFS